MSAELNNSNSRNNLLQILPKENKKLSIHQLKFNSLIERIETLNKKLENDKGKLEHLKAFFKKRITPYQVKIAELQIAIAKEFSNAISALKLGAKQKREIESVIVWLCQEAFIHIGPDEELKTFFSHHSGQTYDELKEEKALKLKQEMADELLFDFGIDIDLNEFENTPEGFARLRERLKEEINKKHAPGDQRKKSKKEVAKELELKREEGEKLKSIRSVYLTLAKMLHPDTVVDDKEKKIREELMKKVTVAYNEKNLSELLKLEMQWVTVESKHIDNLTEEKLKLYISTLLEQVNELQMELELLSENPKYAEVSEYLYYAEKTGLNKIKNLSKVYEAKTSAYELVHRNLSRDQTKRTVLQYLKEFQDTINFEEEESYDDNEDLYF